MSHTFTSKPSHSRTDRGRGRGNTGATNARRTRPPNTSSLNTRHTGGVRTTNSQSNTHTPNSRGRGRSSTMYQAHGYGRGQGGRGRGTADHQRNVGLSSEGNDFNQYGEGASGFEQPGSATQEERQFERRDAYSVMKPNQQKRDKITTQARKEEEAYRQRKESSKPQYVNYSGTVGGGEVKEDTARKQAQHQHVRAKFNSQQKAQEYRQKERQREEEIHEKKKIEQRQKSEENQRKEEHRNMRTREQNNSGRQAWLDKLDRQTREAKARKVLSSTAAKNYEPEPTNTSDTSEMYQPVQYSPGVTTTVPDAEVGALATSLGSIDVSDEAEMTPLQELVKLFPQYDKATLEDVLLNCNGSVHQAQSLLGP